MPEVGKTSAPEVIEVLGPVEHRLQGQRIEPIDPVPPFLAGRRGRAVRDAGAGRLGTTTQ